MHRMKRAGLCVPLLLALASAPLFAEGPSHARLFWSFDTGG